MQYMIVVEAGIPMTLWIQNYISIAKFRWLNRICDSLVTMRNCSQHRSNQFACKYFNRERLRAFRRKHLFDFETVHWTSWKIELGRLWRHCRLRQLSGSCWLGQYWPVHIPGPVRSGEIHNIHSLNHRRCIKKIYKILFATYKMRKMCAGMAVSL